jgi:hypothetical protein
MDDGVRLKDSCGAGSASPRAPYICNTLAEGIERLPERESKAFTTKGTKAHEGNPLRLKTFVMSWPYIIRGCLCFFIFLL